MRDEGVCHFANGATTSSVSRDEICDCEYGTMRVAWCDGQPDVVHALQVVHVVAHVGGRLGGDADARHPCFQHGQLVVATLDDLK